MEGFDSPPRWKIGDFDDDDYVVYLNIEHKHHSHHEFHDDFEYIMMIMMFTFKHQQNCHLLMILKCHHDFPRRDSLSKRLASGKVKRYQTYYL